MGKDASANGHTMIARNEDYRAGWAKHFIITPSKEVASGDVQPFWSGMELGYPEDMTETLKYFSVPDWPYDPEVAISDPTQEYTPMDEVGINEAGVAISSTETQGQNDSAEVFNPCDGLIEEAQIPSIVLPRATSAREGVLIFGDAIETVGAEEAGGFAIADKDEVWYIEYAGSLWVAARVPDDSYIIVPNENVLSNYDPDDTDNFLGAPNVVQLARDNSLLPADEMTDDYIAANGFNFAKAYGDIGDFKYNGVRVWWGHQHFTPSVTEEPELEQYAFFMVPDEPITKKAIMDFLKSDNYTGTAYENETPGETDLARPIAVRRTLESHLVELGEDEETPWQVGDVLWLAMGNVQDSVYLPFCAGITEIPEEYGLGTDERDDESAFWTYYGPAADAQEYDDANGTELELILQEYWADYQDLLIESHRNFVVSAAAARLGGSSLIAANVDSFDDLNNQAQNYSDMTLAAARQLGEEIETQIASGVTNSSSSSSGCSLGAFAPAALLLLLPLTLLRTKR